MLRGKDLDTGEFSADRRDTQFDILRQAQTKVLNLTSWHQIQKVIGRWFFFASLTGRYTSLPAALNSSSARNPELFAYVAAQNRLNAPELFSHKKVGELLEWQRMHELHALPEGWALMPYPEFLVVRRKLMADIVRRGFETLA